MALTFVKRSALPEPQRGKGGSLSVCVTGMGQIVLSSLATKALAGAKKGVAAFDGATMYFFTEGAKAIAKVDPKDMINLSYSKKGGTAAFGGGAILRAAKEYGASHLYDFKGSGNQTFPVTVNEKNGCISWDLPTHLTARPVVKRPKKVKATAMVANPGKTSGVPVMEDELVLESA